MPDSIVLLTIASGLIFAALLGQSLRLWRHGRLARASVLAHGIGMAILSACLLAALTTLVAEIARISPREHLDVDAAYLIRVSAEMLQYVVPFTLAVMAGTLITVAVEIEIIEESEDA